MKIDFHAHFIPAAYLALVRAGRVPNLSIETASGKDVLSVQRGGHYGSVAQRIPLADAWLDTAARIAAMDAAGVDIQVLSAVQFMYHYWLDPDCAAALARTTNEGIAAVVSTNPERFAGMATVPLQDADAAIRELEYAHPTLGLRAVEIGTHVDGLPLDADGLTPFWSRAEELGTTIFVHPYAPLGADHLGDYYLNNLLGNPFETATAVSRLLFGGVFERHPRLRFCLAHGGGVLSSVIGRLDRGYDVNESCRAHCAVRPSSHLSRLWYDTVTHDIDALQYLVGRVGSSQIVLGSDYPFAIGDPDPIRTVEQLRIDRRGREAILGGNAAALLGLN